MKKLKFVFLFLFISPFILISQCGSVYISNQAEMDAFSCATVSYLEISNNDISDPIIDFENLTILDTIYNELTIHDFEFGSNKLIFKALERVGDINIYNTSNLDTIMFIKVDTVIGSLYCEGDNLKLLSFNNLRNIDRFQLNAPNLETLVTDLRNCNFMNLNALSINNPLSIIGFDNLEEIVQFYLGNSGFSDLSFFPVGFSPLYIYLNDCPNLQSLLPQYPFTRINYFSITNCPIIDFTNFSLATEINGIYLNNISTLTNLDFLNNIQVSDASFLLYNNANLTDIQGLRDIQFMSSLTINENENLSDCCICKFLIKNGIVTSSASIKNNGSGCNSIGEVYLNCLDEDNDGYFDNDNCATINNAQQEDFDNDGVGDVCDNCPNDSNSNQMDTDNDGIGDICDTYPTGGDPTLILEEGDIYLKTIGKGVVIKSNNGNCFRITLLNDGSIKTTSVACP